MAKRRVFRRQFLIYPNFQMTMVVINSIVIMVMAMIIGFAGKEAFSHLNQVGNQIHLYPTHPFFALVKTHTQHFYGFVVLTLMGTLLISNALIIFLSHKLTGPIVNLENYFRTIVRRERAPRRQLRFRSGDYFRELPHSINGALSLLRAGVSEDTQTISNIKRQRM